MGVEYHLCERVADVVLQLRHDLNVDFDQQECIELGDAVYEALERKAKEIIERHVERN